MYLDTHAAAGMFLTPWCYKKEEPAGAAGAALADTARRVVAAVDGATPGGRAGIRAGNCDTTIYPASGVWSDHAYDAHGTLQSGTYEHAMPVGGGHVNNVFLPAPAQIASATDQLAALVRTVARDALRKDAPMATLKGQAVSASTPEEAL